MIEIYQTNVIQKKDANQIIDQLQELVPNYKIDFDLEDCDCILRIDSFDKRFDHEIILKTVRKNGFYIQILEDELPLLKA